jgi:hypothetical protein
MNLAQRFFIYLSESIILRRKTMVAYNQAVLFAHKLRSSAFISKSTPPSILTLRKDLELPCQTAVETVFNDSYNFESSDPYHCSSPQHSWKDSSSDLLSSVHHIIPNEQDFQEVLASNAGIHDLNIHLLHWSETEFLYLKHRTLH